MFRVAIVGGEDFGNYQIFQEKCIACLRNKAKSGEHIIIYTTGDTFVKSFSERFKIDIKTFYTDWKKYGKTALKMRNEELLKDCDAIIAFDSGIKDTNMIVDSAISKKINYRIIKKAA